MLKKLLWLVSVLLATYAYTPVASAAGSLSFSDTPITSLFNTAAAVVSTGSSSTLSFSDATPAAAPTTALKFVDPNPPVSEFHEPDPIASPSVTDFHSPPGDIFAGSQNSLVAVAVGSAEGTRTPDGGFTRAYSGHSDPGNGVWNQGSFSYQHGASSPEAADAAQLNVLAGQARDLEQIAQSYSMKMNLEEQMNGIDLANQAPKAALNKGGYVDWLAEAKQLGMTGSDAILYARTNSYIDPSTGTWDAPGLGNDAGAIEHDQGRRMGEISQALANAGK